MKRFLLCFLVLWFGSASVNSVFSTVSSYSFTQNFGFYTPVFGGTNYGNSVTDDAIFTAPLGFPFVYDGISYNTVNIHSNGFIFFSPAWNAANYFPLQSGIDLNVISPCGEDLLSQPGGNISSQTTGIPGDRVFTVQWSHYRHWTQTGGEIGERNFQVKLYELDGKIEFVYGLISTPNFWLVQVGLLGSSLPDFKNRQTSSDWTITLPGNTNGSSCTLNPLVSPPSGLTYVFHPISPISILGMVSPSVPGCSNSANEVVSVRIKNNSGGAINFTTYPVEVHGEVSGVNPQVFPAVLFNSGSIAGNSTLDAIISPGNYNMSVPGTYTFKTNLYSASHPELASDTLVQVVSSLLSAGTAVVAHDSICIGLADTLYLAGSNGTIQWQKFNGTIWVDETAPGSHTGAYLISPATSCYYRAVVCGTLISNIVKVDVFAVSQPVVTGDIRCGPGVVNLSASGSGVLQWYPVTGGDSLSVLNPGFEAPNIPDGGNILGSQVGAPGLWGSFGSVFSYSPNLPSSTYYSSFGVIPPDGAQLAGTQDGLLNAPSGSGIYQISNAVYHTGKKYTLSVMVGGSYDPAGGTQTVRLGAGSPGIISYDLSTPVLAENTVLFPDTGNHFVLNEVSYIATPQDNGKPIVIIMGTNTTDGTQTFDKVRLTSYSSVNTGAAYSPYVSGITEYEVESFVYINTLVCHSSPVTVTAITTPSADIMLSVPSIDVCTGTPTTVSASSSDLGYHYTWSPSTGLDTDTGATVIISPLITTTYTVNCADAGNGCNAITTLEVNIHPTPTSFTINTISSPACSGGGTVLVPVNSLANPAIIGTGTLINAPSSYPAPLGNQFVQAKHQMLYKASEILAAGFTAGAINNISFDIASTNACPQIVNFSIKIGSTNVNSLSAFLPGLVQANLPAWVIPLPGWNTFTFLVPFNWDGVSNIVIETCMENSVFVLNGNTSMRQTATPYVSTILRKENSVGLVCPSTTPNETWSQRPNISFGRDLAYLYTWSPGADLSDSTMAMPTAAPTDTVTYTVTISEPTFNCSTTASGTVYPNFLLPLPIVNVVSASGSFFICPGDSIQLGMTPPCPNCLFKWSPALGISDTSIVNPYVSPLHNTAYTLYATDSLGCMGAGSHVIGLYGAPPVPVITRMNDSLFCSPATTYQWYLNDTLIPGATSSALFVSGNGQYSVEITMGSNTCSTVSNDFIILDTGVLTETENGTFTVYPNPFQSQTLLKYNLLKAENIKIEIINILGERVKILWDGMSSSGDHNLIIDPVTGVNSGNIYFLKFSGESYTRMTKLIELN